MEDHCYVHKKVIDFSDCDLKDITEDEILEILPKVPTKIYSVKITQEELLEISLKINAKSALEFKEWLREYESNTLATYSISTSSRCTGKRLYFKQQLHCKHNTQCSRTYEPDKNNRTRNTNCPASLDVKIRSVSKRKYQGKDPKAAPNPLLPCEIVATTSHNHKLDIVDSLKYRGVSEETKAKLISYYRNGHTPASALGHLKSEIRRTYNNYEMVLADRKYCPDYNYCYYLFRKEFLVKKEPEIINDTVHQDLNETVLVEEDSESLVNKGTLICDEFTSIMKKFLKNSPHEALPAITAGLNAMLQMNTSEVASAFMNFGSEGKTRNRVRRGPIQRTALPRRKKGKNNLSHESQVGGCPRKLRGILKKKNGKIQKHQIQLMDNNSTTLEM